MILVISNSRRRSSNNSGTSRCSCNKNDIINIRSFSLKKNRNSTEIIHLVLNFSFYKPFVY